MARGLPVALGLALVLGLQLWTCRGRFTRPFLDTRLHYDFDNADFAFRARSGLRDGTLRSQFGVTLDRYSRWGERRGPSQYNTDHPFLAKALFQQCARFAGTSEGSSRIYALLLAMLVASGLFVVVLQATGRALPALAAGATLVSLPVFATYQTCIKFEIDGMAAGVWLFASLAAYERRGTRRRLLVCATMVTVSILTHWTAALFAGVLGLRLAAAAWREHDPLAKRALAATAAAGAAGLAALLAAMAYLQGGFGPAFGVLARAKTIRTAPVPASAWWQRQALYAHQNFAPAVPWLVLGLAAVVAFRWTKRRAESREKTGPAPIGLGAFFAATLAVGLVWVAAFPQGSFIHVYWQLWLCLPIAALAGGFVASFPRGGAGERVAALVIAGGVAAGIAASRADYAGILRDQLGTPEDVAFLASLRDDAFDRFVFVPVTDTPLNPWFTGPLFEYYADRAVVDASAPSDVQPGDKLLVLRYKPREDVRQHVAAWSGRSLTNEKCGERICAYDVAGAAR